MGEESETAIKPPLGLYPRWFVDEQRLREILAATERYIHAGYAIPDEWKEEAEEIMERLKKRQTSKG